MLGKDYAGQECALASALEVLGERWTLLIIRDAFFGVRRYGEWIARLDIPRAVLSERLRGLVAHGVMEKRDDPVRPGRTVYELTEAGRDLWPALYALISWGSEHRRRATNVYRHATCKTELGPAARCPACAVVPPADEILVIPRSDDANGRSDPVSIAMRRPRHLLEPLQVAA